MIISDLKGTILAIDEKLAQIFGKSRDELIGTSGYDYVGTEAGKRRRKIIEKVIKTKKPIELIDQNKGRWWKAIFHPILDDKGTVVKLAYYIKDITEEKEAKQNLEKREIELQDISQKFQIITDNMTDFVFQITLTGKFTYVNPASERYGYKPEEMIGKNFTKFVPKKELPRYFTQIRKMISGEKIDCFESFVIHKSGHLIPTEFSGQMVKVGKKHYINGIMRNISERKKLENEREKIDKRYKLILENSNCPVTYLDLEGNIILINKLGAKNLKENPGDLIGKSIYDKLPEFADEQKKRINIILKTEKGITCEDLIDLHDSKKWFLSNLQPVKDQNEKIIGVQIFSVDITDQKEVEGKLRESKEEIKKSKDYLQNVIDNTSEIIFTIDSNYKLRTWNKTAEDAIGIVRRQIVGKYLKQINIFENPGQIKECIQNIFQGKQGFLSELTLNTLYGTKRIFSVSPSYITGTSKNITEILFVCRDITFEKDSHGKLDFGNSYIISESIIDSSLEIFKGLVESKHPSLYIGRPIDEEVKNEFINLKIAIIKLADDKSDDISIVSNFEELYKSIENFVTKKNKSIVFIDRIDYLIANYSFESMMKIFYKINDLIQKHKSILFLRVNPSMFNMQQLSILNEEFNKIPSKEIRDIQITEELFDMLGYIYKENMMNKIVNFNRIGSEFSISKVTVKNRIESLLSFGLILVEKHGKTKVLNITEKGINILGKNQK